MIPSNILPEPFYWIDIPAGRVTLKGGWHRGGNADEVVELTSFQIAQYPITNTQYTHFIEADGYNNPAYWMEIGWELRIAEGWDTPYNWRIFGFGDDCPVGGITWFEAMAFCTWLSEISGNTITLPSEAQWQRAAQGDDARDYPWGDDYIIDNFNHFDSGIEKATPVQRYAGHGNSPFGVIDMAGNCWEWCANTWEPVNGKMRRALRGGSYINYSGFAQTHWRNDAFPSLRAMDVGMRIIRTVSE